MVKYLAIAIVAALVGAPAAAKEGVIRDGGSTEFVPGSYVVVLKSHTTLDDVATRYGGKVGLKFTHALKGFEIKLSERAARRMAADPDVAYVQRNAVVSLDITQTNPPSWGLDRIDRHPKQLNNSYDYPVTAEAVHAYVVDTGIRLTHAEFGGRALNGWDFVNNDGDVADCNGHGTHVAGTLGGATTGVAKGVWLVGVRVLDCQGNGTSAGLIAAIDWVTNNAIHPAVVNMSLGMQGTDNALDTAITNSIASGITYVLSAGNGDYNQNPLDACTVSPARTPNAITVAASDRTDSRTSFSNYGTCVDIFAPGFDIVSAHHTSDTATTTMSGTSMAAPHVAGAAAIVLQQNPAFTPQQVRDQLVNLDPTVGALSNLGAGSPNKLLFVRFGPMRVNVSCSVQTGAWNCSAEAIGAVAPVSYSWVSGPSGICRISKNVTVSATATDSLGQVATGSRTFFCKARCDLQASGMFCLASNVQFRRD